MTGIPRVFEEIVARPRAEVLVIGAGVNGIATFRDLAMQGVDVVLVDRADYCSGASAGSSHMIHGGIRYLENGEFRLVKEAVTERNMLLETAPHHVRPLRTTIPIMSLFSGILSAPIRFLTHRPGRPRERGALLIKVGLVIYDSFSRAGGRVPRHVVRRRARSLAELPRLNPRVKYTATYWDAAVRDPERLCIDLLRDGLIAGGEHARALNYVSVVGVDGDEVTLRDEASGAETGITASVIVNATGPWVDLTGAALGDRSAWMAGTKGSHIVLDHPELLAATGGRELFFENADGRIVLIHPLHGRVLVGTSDLEHDMADPIECTEDEVDYFLELVTAMLPGIAIDRSHIVFRFSGVRPLPAHGDSAPGFVSRDYRIESRPFTGGGATVLTLIGGKWTTFRASAEHLTDRVLDLLGRDRRATTRGVPIGGGLGFPRHDADRRRWVAAHADVVGAARADQLLERYGTGAAAVIDAIRADPDERSLREVPGYSAAEVRHLASTESVVHLDDLVRRRTSIAFTGGVTPAALRELADVVGPLLGWDDRRRADEVSTALRYAPPRTEVTSRR